MTMSPDVPDVAQPPGAAHRSRWRRFSPSMGWRAFWSEIVIVVLGVVIALAANEAVQDWAWRNKVKDAEVRLRYDITWAFLWEAEKYVSHYHNLNVCFAVHQQAMLAIFSDAADRLVRGSAVKRQADFHILIFECLKLLNELADRLALCHPFRVCVNR